MAVQDSAQSGVNSGSSSSGRSLLYDPMVRSLVSQVLLILAVVWLGYEITTNTIENLARQNIASGFGFWENTAGFSVAPTLGSYMMEYREDSSYGTVFWVGLINTLLVAFVGIILATIWGFIIGVARLSNNWVIRKLSMVYVETLRNIPLLLQIFFWYFAVLRSLPNPRNSVEFGAGMFLNTRGLFGPRPIPQEGLMWTGIAFLLGIAITWGIARWAKQRQMATGQQFPVFWTAIGLILGLPLLVFLVTGLPLEWQIPELTGFNFQGGMVIIPEFMSLLLALVLYTAAFIAEIVRAGILAVSHGQTEASNALGLRSGPTLRLVVIPQALRVIIPPLTSQYLNLTKNSSLAVAIAYPDLVSTFAGTTLNQTGQAVEILIITLAVYLLISIVTSMFMNWYNARMALVER